MRLEPSVGNNSALSHALSSTYYQFALVASIAITAPMAFDYAIDAFYHFSNDQEKLWKGFIPRLNLILALAVPDAIFLVVIGPYKLYEFYPCVQRAREIFYLYSFLSYMIEFCAPIWTMRSTSFLSVTFCVANVLSIFCSFIDDSNTEFILGICVWTFYSLSGVFLIVLCEQWVRHVIRGEKTLPMKSVHQVNMYLGACSILALSYVILQFTLRSGDKWQDTGEAYLCGYTVMIATFTAVVTVLNGRMIRREASDSEHALELKKMFVRYISHEIRTPLNTVFMGLKLLEKEVTAQGANRRTLDTIRDTKEACNVALEILNDLLTFDKLEGGLLKLEEEMLRPWTFVRGAVKPFFVQSREAGIELVYDATPRELIDRFRGFRIKADPHKLAQVVRNLVSNALKFTPRDGRVVVKLLRANIPNPNFHHSFSQRRRSNILQLDGGPASGVPEVQPTLEVLRLQVVDSGAGISPENQTKLFKEIIQFNPGKLQNGGGSGLGLFITKGIVDLHGGNISVWSEGEGHGCTFTLELPLETVDEMGVEAEVEEADPADEEADVSAPPRPVTEEAARASAPTPPTVTMETPPPLAISNPPTLAGASATSSPNRAHDSLSPLSVPFSRQESYDSYGSGSLPKKLNILVADDSKMNRKMVVRFLQDRCDKMVEADDGMDAVEQYKKHVQRDDPVVFNIVLMDHHMPRLDGPGAVKAIRALGYKGLIIGVTGNALACDMEVLLRAGADLVMAKPLDLDEFNRVISERVNLKARRPHPTFLGALTRSGSSSRKKGSSGMIHSKPMARQGANVGNANHRVAVEPPDSRDDVSVISL